MLLQRTLANPIRATGVGLHSGKKVLMVVRPAPVDKGIVFRRVGSGRAGRNSCAYAESVGETTLGTTLDQRTRRECRRSSI